MSVVWVVAPVARVPRVLLSHSLKPFHEGHVDGHLESSTVELKPDWANLPSWFEDRMARLNLQRPESREAWAEGARTDYHILGLMRVTHRGSTWNRGPLTVWTTEGELLLDMYHRPADGGILKIIDAVELSEPFLVRDRDHIEGMKDVDYVRNLQRTYVYVM